MKVVAFDAVKGAANIAKHGVSLAEAEAFDFASAVIVEDDRRPYGETRLRAFTRMDGKGFCLIFIVTGETTIRAISLRRAHDKEMRRYGL